MLLGSLLGVVRSAFIFARIVAEFILIVFRINEHLGATPQPTAILLKPNQSGRKPEMHDVAVGDDVVLAFQPHLAGCRARRPRRRSST